MKNFYLKLAVTSLSFLACFAPAAATAQTAQPSSTCNAVPTPGNDVEIAACSARLVMYGKSRPIVQMSIKGFEIEYEATCLPNESSSFITMGRTSDGLDYPMGLITYDCAPVKGRVKKGKGHFSVALTGEVGFLVNNGFTLDVEGINLSWWEQ